VTLDAGTQATGTVSSGAATHEGHGYWTYAPSQAESNGDLVAFTFENSAAVSATVQIYTSFPQTVDVAAGVTLSAVTHTGAVIPTVTNLTNAPTAGDLTATMKTSVENTVWNANASAHTSAGTLGGNLDVKVSTVSGGSFTNADFGIVDTGTAQSATSTTIVLRAAAAFANTELVGQTVFIASASTGSGQVRQITAYNGATDTATVDAWTTTPTGTITYRVFATAPASATILAPVNVTQWLGSSAPANTGDAFARLGAPVTATISQDIAAVKTDTANAVTKATDIQGRIPTALVSGRIDASVGAMAANVVNASALASDAVAEITVGVVDQTMTGHTTSGTVGGALNAAGSSGDPWSTVLPASYASGTAGGIIGNNINASITSRASQTSVDTVGTNVAAVKAKTDSLTFTKPGEIDANIQSVNDTTVTGTGTGTTKWGA
jgi:hypothetical protein